MMKAYPAKPDQQIQDDLCKALEDAARLYGDLAQSAISREDRFTVYRMVKREIEMLQRAQRIRKGFE